MAHDGNPVRDIHFHRTKYGVELAVDAAWIHDLPGFVRTSAWHRLSFYDLTLLTRGSGAVWLDGHRIPIRPGRLVFTTPGQVRRLDATCLDGFCLFFAGDFVEDFFRDPWFLHRLPFFHRPELRPMLDLDRDTAGILQRRLGRMAREIRAVGPDTSHLLRARLYEMLIDLRRAFAAAHGVGADSGPDPLVGRFRALVARHGHEVHRVSEYARRLAVSPDHLNATVRRRLGRTAKSVIAAHLVMEAKRRLLIGAQTIEGVGYALGFESPSYFARFFRQRVGVAPGVWRRGQG